MSSTQAKTTTYLAQQNPHPRDAHIHFDEGPHKYTIQDIKGITPETEFTSVTTWVHQHFEHFDAKKIIAGMMRNQKKWNDPIANAKYYGKTAEEIEQMWASAGRDAATAGTAMHYKIECFYNTSPEHQQQQYCSANDAADDALEFKYFLNFQRDFAGSLRPYRTEWTVFHEEARIAGSIDMVYELIQPDATDATTHATTDATTDATDAHHTPPQIERSSRRGWAEPPCHLRLETMSRNHKNQPRQQIRNPSRNRTSSGHKLLALRTSTKCLQIHSSKQIRQTRHGLISHRPPSGSAKLSACQASGSTKRSR